MYETVPLYYGASCVDNELPGQCIRLRGNLQQDMEIIKNVILQPDIYQNIKFDRYAAWEHFNLIEHLKEIF